MYLILPLKVKYVCVKKERQKPFYVHEIVEWHTVICLFYNVI
jgi:hypothetical protein